MKEDKKKWPLEIAMPIARRLYNEFSPYCEDIAVVGSLRRQASLVSDIDIIIIPKKPFHWGPAFRGVCKAGIVEAIDKYPKLLGDMTDKSKYLRRNTPEGIEFDIWIYNENNWGLAMNTKTGPLNYNINTIIRGLKTKGYAMLDDHVINISTGEIIPVQEEQDLYKLMGIPYKQPKDRK